MAAAKKLVLPLLDSEASPKARSCLLSPRVNAPGLSPRLLAIKRELFQSQRNSKPHLFTAQIISPIALLIPKSKRSISLLHKASILI